MSAGGGFVEPTGPSTGERVLASVLWTVLACLGLGIGLGIGVRWMLDSSVSMTTILCGAALLGGVVALVVAARATWRVVDGWWRAPVLIAWLVAVVALTYVLVVALAATRPPPGAVAAAPVSLPGAEVRMTADDGTALAAWFVKGDNGAAVIVRHGAGSNRFDAAAQAGVLARNGYTVLLTDARGHGNSDGPSMDFGWWGEQDIDAAIDFLEQQPGVDPTRIAVLGLSMGGEEAIGAAGVDPRIRAVVAEGATSRTAADRAWLSEAYGIRGYLQRVLDAGAYGLTGVITSAPKPRPLLDAAGSTDAPILLIAGGTEPDEQLACTRLAAADADRIQVWIVPGAGHIGGLAAEAAEWQTRVLEFLETSLSPEPDEEAEPDEDDEPAEEAEP